MPNYCSPHRLGALLSALGADAYQEFCRRVIDDLTVCENQFLPDPSTLATEDILRQAHILRGIAGTLGARRLEEAVNVHLGSAIAPSDVSRASLDRMLHLLRETRAEMVRCCLPPSSPPMQY